VHAWQLIRIARFGGPEVLELAEEQTVPAPGPGEVRIKVLAGGTGFTDTFIRRGRYPDFKGPLPFAPGYDLVGVVETTGAGVTAPREGQLVADLCVVGGYAQYAICPARFVVPVPQGVAPRLANLPELRVFLSSWKPGRFAGTSWWWTQSCETGLRQADSLLTGKRTGK
jgi:NADPH:quinone reductase-like Zn-dependent oxidoreductase